MFLVLSLFSLLKISNSLTLSFKLTSQWYVDRCLEEGCGLVTMVTSLLLWRLLLSSFAAFYHVCPRSNTHMYAIFFFRKKKGSMIMIVFWLPFSSWVTRNVSFSSAFFNSSVTIESIIKNDTRLRVNTVTRWPILYWSVLFLHCRAQLCQPTWLL